MSESVSPKPRSRRVSRLNPRRPVAELARAIAREPVQFKDWDGTFRSLDLEKVTISRLEQLLRLLWERAVKGDLAATRFLFEYMEGTPARQAAPLTKEDIEILSADMLAKLLDGALARLREAGAGAWQLETEAIGPVGRLESGAPTKSGKSG